MGDVSRNFSRSEFSCQCGCGFDSVDVELLEVLQNLRDYFGEAITITSGNRCVPHNEFVGGAKASFHTKGMAADVKVACVDPKKVYYYLNNKYSNLGLILYYNADAFDGWVHIDVRAGAYRDVKEL
jgi:uncharacterized protein YcbK (DUF882 family)